MPDPIRSPEEEALLAAALAIADGQPVDWVPLRTPGTSVPSEPSTPDSDLVSSGLARVEQIVRGHRELLARDPLPRIPDQTIRTAFQDRHGVPAGDAQVAWGPLLVLDKVGRGTFGDVYRAYDRRLDREVALKLLREDTPEQVGSPAIEEGRLLARVRHPNVVTVYGAERTDGRVGIWMEFIHGRTLAEEVRDRGPLPPDEAVAIAIDVCRALAAVHGANLLHRDVKAQNVMRDAAGRVVLGDFGTGLVREDPTALASQSLAGTPLYLAPEVFERRTSSVASDLYSLGVLLFFLLCGRHPVEGRSLAEIRRRHASGERTSLRSVLPTMPDAIAAVVERLLDPNPDARFHTAVEAEQALLAVVSPDVRASDSTRASRESSWTWQAAAVALAVVVVAAGGWLWQTIGSSSPGGSAVIPADAPVSRQIVNHACIGMPARDGSIACVELLTHAMDRGAKPPLPLVHYRPLTGEMQILRSSSEAGRISSALIAPDATAVVYTFEHQQAPAEIRIVTIATGQDRRLAGLPDGVQMLSLLAWSDLEPRIDVRLWHTDGGHAIGALRPDSGLLESVYRFASVPQGMARSADGRFLAFDVRQSSDAPERDIRVCDIAIDDCATVASHPASDGSPMWGPDGRLLFVSDRSGLMGLWSVALDGLTMREPPRQILDAGRSRPVPIGFAADDTLFYHLTVDHFDIYGADLESTPMTPVRLSPRAVDTNKEPEWSPDGRRLAYVSQRGLFAEAGAVRVVVQDVESGREVQHVLDVRPNMTRLSWSPDGRRLALRTLLGQPPDWVFGIHLLSLDDGRIVQTLRRRDPPEPYFDSQIGDLVWLDDRTIRFSSHGGIREFDVTTGDERDVWRPDPGQVVEGLAVSPDRSSMAVHTIEGFGDPTKAVFRTMIVPHDGGPGRQLLEEGPGKGFAQNVWTADGTALLFSRFNTTTFRDRRFHLWRAPIDGAPPRELSLSHAQIAEFSVHPDGRRVAFMMGAPQSQFWVMTGVHRR